MSMKERGGSPYQPRGIPQGFADVYGELLDLQGALEGQVRFRGWFASEADVAAMSPAARPNDEWGVLSGPTTGTMYRQVSVAGGRSCVSWPVTIAGI